LFKDYWTLCKESCINWVMNKQLADQENSNSGNDSEIFKAIVVFKNTLKNTRVVRECIMIVIEGIIGPKKAPGVSISLEEGIVNAIRHGNALVEEREGQLVVVKDENGKDVPDENKEIKVAIYVTSRLIRIEIENELRERFNPALVPDSTDDERLEIPNGRGILMMNSFSDELGWNNDEKGPIGNRVYMQWHRGNNNIANQNNFEWILDGKDNSRS